MFVFPGLKYWCVWDRDLAPEGDTLEESNHSLDECVEFVSELQQRAGIKPLWVATNLHRHTRYRHQPTTPSYQILSQIYTVTPRPLTNQHCHTRSHHQPTPSHKVSSSTYTIASDTLTNLHRYILYLLQPTLSHLVSSPTYTVTPGTFTHQYCHTRSPHQPTPPLHQVPSPTYAVTPGNLTKLRLHQIFFQF